MRLIFLGCVKSLQQLASKFFLVCQIIYRVSYLFGYFLLLPDLEPVVSEPQVVEWLSNQQEHERALFFTFSGEGQLSVSVTCPSELHPDEKLLFVLRINGNEYWAVIPGVSLISVLIPFPFFLLLLYFLLLVHCFSSLTLSSFPHFRLLLLIHLLLVFLFFLFLPPESFLSALTSLFLPLWLPFVLIGFLSFCCPSSFFPFFSLFFLHFISLPFSLLDQTIRWWCYHILFLRFLRRNRNRSRRGSRDRNWSWSRRGSWRQWSWWQWPKNH